MVILHNFVLFYGTKTILFSTNGLNTGFPGSGLHGYIILTIVTNCEFSGVIVYTAKIIDRIH